LTGLLIGVGLGVVICTASYFTKGEGRFNLDPKGIPGAWGRASQLPLPQA